MQKSTNPNLIFCLITFIILVFESSTGKILAQDSKRNAEHSFKIFSQIRYNNTPEDLAAFGLSKSILHPSGTFLNPVFEDPNSTGNGNADNKIIDSEKLIALAKNDLKSDPKTPVILDIESWNFKPSEISKSLHDFQRVISIYKSVNPTSPLGFYSTFPQNKYEWKRLKNKEDYKKWQSLNDNLKNITKDIQFFAPSLYTRENISDSANWKSFAQANINECRRLNSKIPVYAYIQPQIAKTAEFLSADFWNYELNELYKMGYDGVIIWTSNKDQNGSILTFSEATKEDWWKTTLNFIKAKNIKTEL